MHLKSIVRSLVAVAALASIQAHASTTDLGTLSTGVPKSFNATSMPAGPFSDVFSFGISSPGSFGISVINFPVTGLFNSVFTSASLISNPDGVLFNSDDSLLSVGTLAANTISFLSGPVGAGSYYLNVNGIGNGSLGGLYNGSISVAAVPEPETYAMLLAGMGVMGFIARRRNKAQ